MRFSLITFQDLLVGLLGLKAGPGHVPAALPERPGLAEDGGRGRGGCRSQRWVDISTSATATAAVPSWVRYQNLKNHFLVSFAYHVPVVLLCRVQW